MCGRFTLRTRGSTLTEQFACEITDLPPRYNIAPTQMVAAVRRSSSGEECQFLTLRWGLVPSWAKDLSIGNRLINARAETIAEKPAFRVAFRRRRCLVLADGYFEWLKKGRSKQPYYFRMRDERPFAFAGIWEAWRDDPKGTVVQTCTIITTDANDLSRPIHNRMPVILDKDDCQRWLDPSIQDPALLRPILRPFDSQAMIVDPVSTHVNSPRNDDPRCVEVLRELF